MPLEAPESAPNVTTVPSTQRTAEAAGGKAPAWLHSEQFRVLRWLGATILIAILVQVFVTSTYRKDETIVKSYEVWGVFHYYLGAKYFPELGYFNLYPCALEADRESEQHWSRIVGARDMHTYRVLPQSSLPPCPRDNFAPERWSEFSRDVEHFARQASPIYFAQLFTDKGFNPPPSWVAIAHPLAQAVPLSSIAITNVIFNLDVVALLIAVWIIWRGRGGNIALMTAALAIFYFGSFGRIGGNYLQYFWFPLVVAAVVLWSKHKPACSGAALGAAAALQAFPIFFAVPVVLRGFFDFSRRRKRSECGLYLRFTSALAAVLIASFLSGSLAGRGLGAWGEWRNKIAIHKSYLKGELFNIGLANLTAAAVSNSHSDASSYSEDIPNTLMRLDSLKSNIWIFYSLCAVLVALWALAVVRAPARDLFGHGFLIMYAVVSLSPYYYLCLALLPFMFWESHRSVRIYAGSGTVVLFAAHSFFFPRTTYVFPSYRPHLLSECSIAIFLSSLAALCIFATHRKNQERLLEDHQPSSSSR